MALSNLRNEPRREIIEQAMGIVAIGLFLWLDYALTQWLGANDIGSYIAGMVLVGIGLIASVVLIVFSAFIIHVVGEEVCAGLNRLGLDPRPKQRYRR